MSAPFVHLNPPFRVEHIGSFIRPKSLYQKRALLAEEQCSVDDLKDLEDEAIKHAVQMQRSLGIRTITDGEQRRNCFFDGVFEKLEGMTYIPNRPIETFKPYIPHVRFMRTAGIKEASTFYCAGKIKRVKPFYIENFNYLKTLVPAEDVKFIKITMCSPSWFHQRHGSDMTYDTSVYKNDDEYFDDLGIAYREEIQELYALGCRHIQIDDPTFCYFCADSTISGMESAGIDHEALLDTYIRAINICVEDRPKDLRIGVHMCRGNFTGGVHFCEGGYHRIARKLFNNLNVDVFYMEYDTERAGNFEPLKYLPLGKVAVLGLVTTKNAKLESVEILKARVEEAAQVIAKGIPPRPYAQALAQLCISPQCGFASTWEGNPLTEKDQKDKLLLLLEVAKHIWGE